VFANGEWHTVPRLGRPELVQMMIMQFKSDNLLITSLEEYRRVGPTNTLTSLVMRFYTELSESKGVRLFLF